MSDPEQPTPTAPQMQMVMRNVYQFIRVEAPKDENTPLGLDNVPPGFRLHSVVPLAKSPIVGSKEYVLLAFEGQIRQMIQLPPAPAAPKGDDASDGDNEEGIGKDPPLVADGAGAGGQPMDVLQ